MSQRCMTVPCAATGSSCIPPHSMEHANEVSCCIGGQQLLNGVLMCSILLLGAQAEKPDQRGAQQQELIAAQPSMPWNQILESLELTEHQRKVCNQGPGVSPQPQSQPCPDRNPWWCPVSAAHHAAVLLCCTAPCVLTARRRRSGVTVLRRGVCRHQMQTWLDLLHAVAGRSAQHGGAAAAGNHGRAPAPHGRPAQLCAAGRYHTANRPCMQ